LLGEDNAEIGPRILHGQWSSPSIGTVNGKTQVYFGGGDGVLYAFDPTPTKEGDSSFLKKIWWFDAVPEEYKKDKSGKPIKYPRRRSQRNQCDPVFYKNRVYVAIGQDPEHGEGVGRLVCVDPTKTGDITKSGLIWDYKGVHRSISTVSIDPSNGLLFIGDFSGFVHCLDAENGKLNWVHDMQAHMWGSTFVTDGKVYVGDEDGDFVVPGQRERKEGVVRGECRFACLLDTHRRQRRDDHRHANTSLCDRRRSHAGTSGARANSRTRRGGPRGRS
jgi:outer membrane protein assembly factor BamB